MSQHLAEGDSLGYKGQHPQEGAWRGRGTAAGAPTRGKMDVGSRQSQAHQKVAPSRAMAGSCWPQPWVSPMCLGCLVCLACQGVPGACCAWGPCCAWDAWGLWADQGPWGGQCAQGAWEAGSPPSLT